MKKSSEKMVIAFRKQIRQMRSSRNNMIVSVMKNERLGLKDALDSIEREWKKRYCDKLPSSLLF